MKIYFQVVKLSIEMKSQNAKTENRKQINNLKRIF